MKQCRRSATSMDSSTTFYHVVRQLFVILASHLKGTMYTQGFIAPNHEISTWPAGPSVVVVKRRFRLEVPFLDCRRPVSCQDVELLKSLEWYEPSKSSNILGYLWIPHVRIIFDASSSWSINHMDQPSHWNNRHRLLLVLLVVLAVTTVFQEWET